ncbi:type II secretion system protein GspM [Halorhodospira halophila]|uniref:MSHA biogenesis protein MshJ n=1 Tax=Halorhodospira halophila (strain DSM 244 / SL1) TaxID=349124 RepID=A1WTW3_HALHL|nr:type II secretion system protein GspM [Halorhodospira halophila]ABM61125.1 MSHA biogenesis protein MshJ [Halorhodospira halophila SL1]MBK1730166.1 hypothetical protein [Halorhodospira halophila]
MDIRRSLQQLNDALNARTPRERVLMVIAGLGVIGAGWYYLLFEPMQQRSADAQQRIESAEQQIRDLRTQRESLEAELGDDPEADVRAELDALRDELLALERDVGERVPEFIEPERMRQVLRAVLAEHQGARLVRLERLPAQEVAGVEDGDDDAPQIFRHSVHLEFEADYATTVAYLQAVEALEWQFAWESLDYEVTDHPRARVRVRLHTLSGHRAWLGV